MWFRKKKPERNLRALEAANREILRAFAQVEKIPYDGDAFVPNHEEAKEAKMNTDPQVNEKALARFEVDRLPTLVSASVESLSSKRAEIEQELKNLKTTYELNKNKLTDRLEKVKLSIRAWEAAQAVYKDAEQATIEHEAKPAPEESKAIQVVKKTRLKK